MSAYFVIDLTIPDAAQLKLYEKYTGGVVDARTLGPKTSESQITNRKA